jgi:RNA-directed DNA polymerase
MRNRLGLFDKVCEFETLIQAWKQVRANHGAAGVDLVTIRDYEQNLRENLEILITQLKSGQYYPMPVHSVNIQKANGKIRKLGILTVEDRLIQRATFNVIEPLFEPTFLDCSYGFRPNLSTKQAIEQVIDYYQQGNNYVVDADISNFFDSIDIEILMELLKTKIKDKRLLSLIYMWISIGQVLPQEKIVSEKPVSEKIVNYVTSSADEAVKNLLNTPNYDNNYDYASLSLNQSSNVGDDDPEAFRKNARKEALKRLGKDGLLLLLTYSNHLPKLKRFLTPQALVITGAIGLALSVYPVASHFFKNRQTLSKTGIIQGSPLSPLLSNIYLHEFDKSMLKEGFNLVRFADDWVIMCPSESIANKSLEIAKLKLSSLRLSLNTEKTKITHFDDGFKFLGHNFGTSQNANIELGTVPNQIVTKIGHLSSKVGKFMPNVINTSNNLTKKGMKKIVNFVSSIKK